jgi:hypothetical protein
LSIDKNQIIQQRVIAEIDAAVRSGPTPARAPAQPKPRQPVAHHATPQEPSAKRASVAD